MVGVLAAVWLGWSGTALAGKTISVGTGMSQSVTLPRSIKEVHVLDQRVADVVRAAGRTVTVVGVSPGVTELLVTPRRGRTIRIRIRVSKAETTQLFSSVKEFIGPVVGLMLRQIGDLVIIEGRALTLGDYRRVVQARRLFGKKVINLAGYHPSAVQELNKVLQGAGLSTVKATLVGGKLFLEGSVGSKQELRKVRALVGGKLGTR